MAQQRVHRFRLDKPVPYNGRKRTKKKKQFRPETVPDGWAWVQSRFPETKKRRAA